MVNYSIVSTALSTIAIMAISSNNSNVCAFQLSRRSAVVSLTTKQTTSTFNVVNIDNNIQYTRQSTSISMSALSRGSIARDNSSKRQRVNSLFQTATTKSRHVLQKIRHSFTILLASLAFFLSSTHVMHTPPAHASSSIATATATLSTTTTKSLKQRLNIFKTKSADEMIDTYVQSKLFADDVYDPIESAYREAYADSLTNKDAVAGAYPTL